MKCKAGAGLQQAILEPTLKESNMSGIILHHYPMSPFAEKIRLILGYKQLDWQSVTIPTIMPKPDLVALTGGYRRTPVMQIGADIYCDTALIAEVIDDLVPERSLFSGPVAALARTLAQWADTTLFWTAIPYLFQPCGAQEMFGKAPPEFAKAFVADRAAMRGGAKSISVDEATINLSEYLTRLESMLAHNGAFLLGAQPCIFDFSVYHTIWFVQGFSTLNGILQSAPRLLIWFAQMQAFGHHTQTEISSEQALAIARESIPLPTEGSVEQNAAKMVSVTPSDYALDPVEGELVFNRGNHIALRREDARAGKVVVHFPHIGFRLEGLAPAI
jgi:glutathione S-transferase